MEFAEEEVTAFVDTNLGTRIAMTVHIGITSGDFERNFEKTHASCLPSFGEIRVHGIMVKRKSRFYDLAQSMPIKYVFRDNQKPWFIHAEARLVNRSQQPTLSNSSIVKSQITHCFASGQSLQGENKKIKKSRTKPVPKHDSRNLASLEPETVMSSSPLSVPRASECFLPKTPEKKRGASVSRSETVRQKLTVAANNIRMQGKSHLSSSLSSSIFRSKTLRMRSLDGKTATSLSKLLVFEIPDTED